MGFFNKKVKKNNSIWDNAYIAKPHFYEKDDKTLFGTIALTEATDTILPKKPQYKIDDVIVSEYKICFIGLENGEILGIYDYFETMKELEKFILEEKKQNLLIGGLSFNEIKMICDKFI